MLCQNCGEHEANVRYTQIVNGTKKEMALCQECSKKLGLTNMDFSMPINLSSFLGDFFNAEENFLPSFINTDKLICNECGMTYEDFTNTGKFGCENCYQVFSTKIDPILKNIHSGNRHVGRKAKLSDRSKKISIKKDMFKKEENKPDKKDEGSNQLEKLKQDLKIAIKEERYEDAAKIRDQIKKWGV